MALLTASSCGMLNVGRPAADVRGQLQGVADMMRECSYGKMQLDMRALAVRSAASTIACCNLQLFMRGFSTALLLATSLA